MKTLIPLGAIALVLLVNLGNVGVVSLPKELHTVARFVGLEQKWTLFAPHPPRETGWLVIPATLSDGTEVDLFTGGAVTYEKPDMDEHRFSNQRWGRLIGRTLKEPALTPYRAEFAEYLCNERGDVDSLSIYLMYEAVGAPGATETPRIMEPMLVYEGACPTSQAQ